MVTLSAGGSHDRRIGDRRAVIAADSACAACRDTDDQHRIIGRENTCDDRNQNTESPPGSARGEAQKSSYDKYDRRQHDLQTCRSIIHYTRHEHIGAQETCNAA